MSVSPPRYPPKKKPNASFLRSIITNAKKVGENTKSAVSGALGGAKSIASGAANAAQSAGEDIAAASKKNFGTIEYRKYVAKDKKRQAEENRKLNAEGKSDQVKKQTAPKYEEFVKNKAGQIAKDTVNSLFGPKKKERKPTYNIASKEERERRSQEKANEIRARGYNK